MLSRIFLFILFIWTKKTSRAAQDGCYSFQVWRPEEDVLLKFRALEVKCDNATHQLEKEALKTRNELLVGLKQYQNWTASLERDVMNLKLSRMEDRSQQRDLKAELSALNAEVNMLSEKSDNLQIDYINIRSKLARSIPSVRRIDNTAELLESETSVVVMLKDAVGDLKAEWLLMKRELIDLRRENAQLKIGQNDIKNESTTLKQQYQTMRRNSLETETTANRNAREKGVLRNDIDGLKQDLVRIKNTQRNTDMDVQMIEADIASLKTTSLQVQRHVERIRTEMSFLRRLALSPNKQDQIGQTQPIETDITPSDCHDVYLQGYSSSGMYYIKPKHRKHADQVYCEISNTTGYTLIQRRTDDTINFNRGWLEYKFGFGNLYGDHWLGNDMVHFLTSQQNYVLRVDLWDWEGNVYYAEYLTFGIDDSSDGYMLHVAMYSGTAGDSLSFHNEMKFSTEDMDNDHHERNCAAENKGGWWFNSCYTSNLNGLYHTGWYSQEQSTFADGIVWYTLRESDRYSVRKVELKLRRN